MLWAYRATVVALLSFACFKLYQLERSSPSTSYIEQQLSYITRLIESRK